MYTTPTQRGLDIRPLDELIRRYVAGEIGDRTARYVMGWDAHHLLRNG